MNYIGSKYSLIDFIEESIFDVTGYNYGDSFSFADLFAGTGIVGSSFKKLGCDVISNDIQFYSYVINKHYIENSDSIDTTLSEYLNNLDGIEGFIYKNYCPGSGSGRNYFTDDNGKRCDAIRTELEEMYLSGKIDKSTYYYYLASLINSIDKFANTASVYGAFLKHTKKSAQKHFELELLPIISGKKGKVYNTDINRLINNISGDVLYLDPPYNARQYCTNYHVLETIAKYDNPTLKGVTGLRQYSEQKSNYCSSRQVESAFEDLISKAKYKYVFLSYNNEGIMPIQNIERIMSKYGKYTQYMKDYRRFKADKDTNRNISSSSTTEFLHCLIKE